MLARQSFRAPREASERTQDHNLCFDLNTTHYVLPIYFSGPTTNAVTYFKLALHEDLELQSMTEAAAEPLISTERDFPTDPRDYEDEEVEYEVDERALASPGLFIWGLTICAGVSGLLFGYEYVICH